MKKITFTFCTFLCCTLFSNAQITWEKLFVQSNTDVFRSVQEVPAGGYIAAGYTSHWSSSDTDAYVVRLTATGDTMWTRTFDRGKKELFYKVVNTADGGFAFCGYRTTSTDLGNVFYMKLDGNGNFLWEGTYGGSGTERGQEIIQTADGGYAICGYTNSGTGAQGYNAFLLKLDATGSQSWNFKYGTNAYEEANSLKQLPNGDFILAGQQQVSGQGDIWLVRTNSSGVQQWVQNLGTPSNDNAEYLQLAASGGYIICGSTQDTHPPVDDAYLVKTDDLGNVQWSKSFGGTPQDDFHRVENTLDGGYIVTGTTQTNAAVISNEWLVKTNDQGDSSWAYTFGGENHDHAYSGVQTSDGGYILCGYSASFGFNYEDAHIIKVDSNGLLYNHLIYTTVTALVSPVGGVCGSSGVNVTITVRNFGDTTISVYPDSVIITGAINQALGQTFNTTLVPLDFTNHTFSTTINTSVGGVFHFHCFTNNNNDVYPAMNSFDADVTFNAQAVITSVENDTICGPGSVTLSASGQGTIEWYINSTGGVAINTGATYTTSISNTTTYYVQVVNACGTSTRVAVTGVVGTPTSPPTVFSAERCGPGDVTLLASSGSPISWWDSATGGNMVAGNVSSFVATVTTTTIFYVEAGTGSPCPSIRVPDTATVNPLPDAAFTPNAPALCLGDAFQFTNTTTGAVSYFWDFGDANGTSSQSDPTYTYAQTGNYDVLLIAQSDHNCFDTVIVNVGVNTAPQVSFSTSEIDGCLPFNPGFINSTTNATNYLWHFGDGGTSTDQFPAYSYMTEGTFTVTLYASVGSCADSDSIVNMITTHASPIVYLGPDISTNSVVYDIDAGPGFNSYLWDNGATTQTITADTSGTYCVTVTSSNSCSASDCINVFLDVMGIADATQTDALTLFPNPVHDQLNLSISNPAAWNIGTVKVYDTFGKKIFEQSITGSELIIQVSEWNRGLYTVEISSGKKLLRQKLVVY